MTRTKIQQTEFEDNLKSFYHFDNGKCVCKKCNLHIKTKQKQHYIKCDGNGPHRTILKKTENKNFIYSSSCDMGCGQKPNFFHKNGKAYCSKFGANCPIKIEADRVKKNWSKSI